MPAPSLSELANFVRSWTGIAGSVAVGPETRLQADLGVTGDDGHELLEAVADRFGVVLASPDDGYRASFCLAPNVQLFSNEGVDLLGVGSLIRRLFRQPSQLVCDLTVAQLHAAVTRANAGSAKVAM